MDFVKEHLLLVEYLILASVSFAYWMLDAKSKVFDKVLNVLMLILVAGIPIIYSSITRSVFEVNKLLLLRVVLFLGYGIWLTRNILLQSQDKKNNLSYHPSLLVIVLFLSILGLVGYLPLATSWKVFSMLVLAAAAFVVPSLAFRWTYTRMEWIFLLWLIVNTLSTVFSQNIYVSMIGSYDRWEGIFTVFNYSMLTVMFAQLVKTTRSLYWITGAILVSTTLSAIYGIFQSFGVDFMHWSVDPTSRVFASINNPVHYSAYVGMLVPLGLGLLLHFWSVGNTDPQSAAKFNKMKWVIYISTFLCYYALYLSFSRAATLGFCAAITMVYLFSFELFSARSKRDFIIDFLLTTVLVAVFYVDYIFNYFQASNGHLVLLISVSILAFYLLYQLFYLQAKDTLAQKLYHLSGLSLLMVLFFLDDRFDYLKQSLSGKFELSVIILYVLAYLFVNVRRNGYDGVKLAVKFIIIYAFAKLQFVVQSWSAIGIYMSLLPILYILVQPRDLLDNAVKGAIKFFSFIILLPLIVSILFERTMIPGVFSPELGVLVINLIFLSFVSYYLFLSKGLDKAQEKNYMLFSFMLLFAVIVFVPSFSEKINQLFISNQSTQLRAADNAEAKVGSYATIAIQGSARTSMWKSAFVWSKDYWLVGSGPDTVKEMYPKYRRPDYGILEGGHNLTPDRVHNEYLNTIITTGAFSFIIRWLLFVGGFILISLLFLYDNLNKPLYFLLVGTMCGAIVHIGQLNFNFSVVATAVLYYVLIGLSLAIGYHGLGNPVLIDIPDVDEQSIPTSSKLKSMSKKDLKSQNEYFDEPFDMDKLDFNDWMKLLLLWGIVGILIWQAFLPYMAERYYRDGFNASSQKNFDLSTQLLTIACNYAPWETQYRVQLGKDYEDMAATKSDPIEKLKYLKAAEVEYDKIIKISPLNPWYLNRQANIYLQYQMLSSDPAVRKTYLDKAGELLKSASEIDNNNPLFHMSYGYYLHKLGRFDAALAEYNHVLDIDGRMTEARFNIADIYRGRGEITKSVAIYEYIASNDAAFGNIHDSLGRIYFNQGQFEKAAFEFEKALISNPSDVNLLRNLGATYHRLGKWDKAISIYRNALRLAPGDRDLRRFLAHAYYNQGDIAQAIINMEEVAKAMPADPVVAQNLAAMKAMLQRRK